MDAKLSLLLLALSAVAYVKAASLGDALVTVYADSFPADSQLEGELVRDVRDAEGRGHLLQHLHQHHHHHHGGGEEYYSKPTYEKPIYEKPTYEKPTYEKPTCYKCGGGSGPVATFAQSSAGTISGGDHGGHGGPSNSVSQSAAYNFGPFSASFSASQSNGGFGGFYH